MRESARASIPALSTLLLLMSCSAPGNPDTGENIGKIAGSAVGGGWGRFFASGAGQLAGAYSDSNSYRETHYSSQ